MSRPHIPRAFDPAGWDFVCREMINAEQRLRQTSGTWYKQLLDSHGTTNSTPSGWAWFTSAGFCDANDRERMTKSRNLPMPLNNTSRQAGHNSMDQQNRVLRIRAEVEGRGQFLDRTDPPELARISKETLGTMRQRATSEPRLPIGALGGGAVASSTHGGFSVPSSPSAAWTAAQMSPCRGGKNTALVRDRCPKNIFGPVEPNLSGFGPRKDGIGLRPFNHASNMTSPHHLTTPASQNQPTRGFRSLKR